MANVSTASTDLIKITSTSTHFQDTTNRNVLSTEDDYNSTLKGTISSTPFSDMDNTEYLLDTLIGRLRQPEENVIAAKNIQTQAVASCNNSLDSGAAIQWNWKEEYLWLPYVVFAALFIIFLFASFLRFHFVNKERYELRRERLQQLYEQSLEEKSQHSTKNSIEADISSENTSCCLLRWTYYRNRFRRSSESQYHGHRGRSPATLQYRAMPYQTDRKGLYAGAGILVAMFSPNRMQQVHNANNIASIYA